MRVPFIASLVWLGVVAALAVGIMGPAGAQERPPADACQETLATFRTLADRLDQYRKSLEVENSGLLNRVRALEAELKAAKEPKGNK